MSPVAARPRPTVCRGARLALGHALAAPWPGRSERLGVRAGTGTGNLS